MRLVGKAEVPEDVRSKDERDGGRREGVIINDGWGPLKIEIVDGEGEVSESETVEDY